MKDINNEVEQTLRSWDKLDRYEGNPFLYTRIEQQLKNIEAPKAKIRWTWQPIVVSVLVIVNAFTIATALTSQSDTIYDDIASQYNLTVEDSNDNYFLIN